MSVSYTRPLSSFTAGLNPDRFTQEIRDSATILIALDYLQIEPPDVLIWFKASLTAPEIAALDALITAHSGLPLPDAALQVIITDDSDKTITGAIVYDRTNGGTLNIPAGSSFPGTPVAGELFWRTDTSALYRRNAGNTAWDAVVASVAGADHGTLSGLGDDDHTQYQLRSEKGAASGYAGLQAGGDISDATHGTRGGGTLHAAATGAVAGFLSAADKTKLDGVATGATNTPLTSSAPADVTKAAAAVGVATSAARADHKHDISTAAPGTTTFGAAAEGAATTLARSDHSHALTAPAAPANVTKAAAVAGVSANVAREDHKHDVTTASAVAVGTANAEGAATSLARSDHTHQVTGLALAGQAQGDVLYFNGTAWVRLAPGTAGEFLRTAGPAANPTWGAAAALTASAPVNVTKSAAVVGVATDAARADHKHDVTTAAPATGIGGGNSEGAATSLARSDHSHALRETGGPADLTIGAIADGRFVRRVGTALVGSGSLIQTQVAEVVANTTTTSTSFVDLLVVNITTGANPVLIRAMGHFSCVGANVNMRFRVTVDGVSEGGGQVRSTAAGVGIAVSLQFKTAALSAGVHVIRLQWLTASSTAQCRPVAAADSETASLIVEEVNA